MSEIASKVKAVVIDKLGIEESEVTDETSFTNDLRTDSLGTVELIMEFEREFGISIPSNRTEKIGTIDDVVPHIEEHVRQFDFINTELRRVVVTGLGVITPVGNSVPEFQESIVNGVSGAGSIAHFDTSLFKTRLAYEVKDFDATKYIDRKEVRKTDLYTQYIVAAAKEAVNNSGLDVEREDLNKIDATSGIGIGGIHASEEEIGNYHIRQEMGPEFNPFFISKTISDITAGQISIIYGSHGPNCATCSACATLTNAIVDAFNLTRLSKVGIIVPGDSEAAISPVSVGGFDAMHALSTRNDKASKASRPFSAGHDGFATSEDGGCSTLEELEHAKACSTKIYAEVAGVGMSADTHHLTVSHPEGLGAKLVMMNVSEDTEMDPKEVDYINIHGTSTPVGDISETKAIKEVFGDHALELNISSIKSMTSHLLGAAGAVEPTASILAIKNGIVPPAVDREESDDDENTDYNLNFTFNKVQKHGVNVALSNTLGSGDRNTCVIFKKYAEQYRATQQNR